MDGLYKRQAFYTVKIVFYSTSNLSLQPSSLSFRSSSVSLTNAKSSPCNISFGYPDLMINHKGLNMSLDQEIITESHIESNMTKVFLYINCTILTTVLHPVS